MACCLGVLRWAMIAGRVLRCLVMSCREIRGGVLPEGVGGGLCFVVYCIFACFVFIDRFFCCYCRCRRYLCYFFSLHLFCRFYLASVLVVAFHAA